MILKRKIPLVIVFVVGVVTFASWFIPHPPFGRINFHSSQWFQSVAAFAVILGALNLVRHHGRKVLRRQRDWSYSLVTLAGFALVVVAGFFYRGGYFLELHSPGPDPQVTREVLARETGIAEDELTFLTASTEAETATVRIPSAYLTSGGATRIREQIAQAGAEASIRQAPWGAHVQARGTLFSWIFSRIYSPLDATIYALLAFFVASAAYRAFRARNLPATFLLVAGVILMLGRIPLGHYLTSWVPEPLAFLRLPELQDWIYNIPNRAGARAIMIGIALGVVGTALRVILGIDRTFMGEE